MDKKNLMPQQTEPVNRITTGQLHPELVELSEEILEVIAINCSGVMPSGGWRYEADELITPTSCSYGGVCRM